MKSFTFLKDSPLAFTLRLLALITILSIVGINLMLIPGQVRSLKRAYFLEIYFTESESSDYAVITSVGSEAAGKGVSVGDLVLNPQAYHEGEIGVPLTLLIKSGNAPAREVTFIPRAINYSGYFLTQLGLSPHVILHLQIIFLWASLLLTGLFSIVAFQLRLDAWLAFLVAVAFSHLSALVSGNPYYYFFKLFVPSALIFFLVVFPTGRAVPRWSWLLIFLPLPHNMSFMLFRLGILERAFYVNFFSAALDGYGAVCFLIILWGILYESRHRFPLFQKRWVNWLSLGLILVNIPSWNSFLLFLGIPRSIVFIPNLNNLVYSIPFARSLFPALYSDLGLVPILIVLAVVVYRYHYVFKPVERQQMKWLMFGLIWIVTLLVVCYMFNLYYFGSNQYSRAEYLFQILDKFFLLAAEVTIFCVLLALFRYRLNDIDTLLNHAFVYSGLIIAAGTVYLVSTMLVDSVFGRLDDQNSARTLLLFVVLIAITFQPARRWLQKLVDEHFRAEEFDFAEAFYEFAPDMYGFFTMSELSKALAARSVEQFGVTYASVYTKNGNGKLQHAKTEPAEGRKPKSVIDSQGLAKLEAGELVFPAVDSTYSLILPLVLPRGRKPDLIGALVLGQRLNGLVYSTAMINKLKSFGQEVGKVLYTVRLRDQGSKLPARKLTAKRAPVVK